MHGANIDVYPALISLSVCHWACACGSVPSAAESVSSAPLGPISALCDDTEIKAGEPHPISRRYVRPLQIPGRGRSPPAAR